MTACYPILSVLAACSLLVAVQAPAQPAAAQTGPAAASASAQQAPAGNRSAPAPATLAHVGLASPAAARGLATTQVTAAGSVLVLADGIVAHARTAQVQPPAPGFQYER